MRNKIRHLCILIRGYFIKIYAAGQTRFEDAKVPFDINGLLSELNEKQMLLKKNTHPDQILVLPWAKQAMKERKRERVKAKSL